MAQKRRYVINAASQLSCIDGVSMVSFTCARISILLCRYHKSLVVAPSVSALAITIETKNIYFHNISRQHKMRERFNATKRIRSIPFVSVCTRFCLYLGLFCSFIIINPLVKHIKSMDLSLSFSFWLFVVGSTENDL